MTQVPDMGKARWDEFCVICGGPPYPDKPSPAAQSAPFPKATAWLQDWVGVTPEEPEEPIDIGTCNGHGCWELFEPEDQTFASYGQWADAIAPDLRRHALRMLHGPAGDCGCSLPPYWDDEVRMEYDEDSEEEGGEEELFFEDVCPKDAPEPDLHWLDVGRESCWARYGVAFHASCEQPLQERLGYAVSFRDVWPLLEQSCKEPPSSMDDCGIRSSNHLRQLSYGGIERYQGRTVYKSGRCSSRFAFSRVSAAHEYLLLDPLQCSSNADRIVAVWEPLVQQFWHADSEGRADSRPAGGDDSTAVGPSTGAAAAAGAGAISSGNTAVGASSAAAAAAATSRAGGLSGTITKGTAVQDKVSQTAHP